MQLVGRANYELMRYGRTILKIVNGVKEHRLTEPFSSREVNRVLGIAYAGTFLTSRVGSGGGTNPPRRASPRMLAAYLVLFPRKATAFSSAFENAGVGSYFPSFFLGPQ